MGVDLNLIREIENLFQRLLGKRYRFFPLWKGRVAEYVLLRSLGVEEGDEVIVSAFTCVVAVNPVLYTGAKPVFVDIDPVTLNMDPSQVKDRISSKTKVIIAQNTFGLPADIERLKEVAQKRGIELIVDSAHGLGSLYKGKPEFEWTKGGFVSFQWNKPVTTGLGGGIITADEDLSGKIERIFRGLYYPSFKERFTLHVLISIYPFATNPLLYWNAVRMYRWLSAQNVVLGSSQREEIESTTKPNRFEKTMANFQLRILLRRLEKFPHILENRKKVAKIYREALTSLGIKVPVFPEIYSHAYLRFPIFVRDRALFFRKAEHAKIKLGDWFSTPIHPVGRGFEKWGYRYGENPMAERASRHVVNLLTTYDLDRKRDYEEISRTVEFLEREKDLIITDYPEFLKTGYMG